MRGTGDRNEQTRRRVQKENGELNVILPTGKMKKKKGSGTGKCEYF
jgi:hypothetical protein